MGVCPLPQHGARPLEPATLEVRLELALHERLASRPSRPPWPSARGTSAGASRWSGRAPSVRAGGADRSGPLDMGRPCRPSRAQAMPRRINPSERRPDGDLSAPGGFRPRAIVPAPIHRPHAKHRLGTAQSRPGRRRTGDGQRSTSRRTSASLRTVGRRFVQRRAVRPAPARRPGDRNGDGPPPRPRSATSGRRHGA